MESETVSVLPGKVATATVFVLVSLSFPSDWSLSDQVHEGFSSDHNSAFSSNKHVHYNNNNDHQHDNHNEHHNDSQDHNRRNINLSKMHIDTRNHHNYELNQLNDGSVSFFI
jgi:hypothetical protein